MKLFHPLLFTVFVGVAFGKRLECLETELLGCAMVVSPKDIATDETDQCNDVNQLVTCLENAEKTCQGEAEKTMKDLVNVLRDLCNKDSQLFKDMETHRPCLQAKEFDDKFQKDCTAGLGKDFKNLGQPDINNLQDYYNKVMNLVCEKREPTMNCAYGQVKSACGEAAQKFIHNFLGPFDELLKITCNGASISSISMGAVVFLQLLIAIFSFRRYL